MQKKLYNPLPWDSEFFGLRIARYASDHLTDEAALEALESCRREGIDCLYLLLADDAESLAAAEHAHLQAVDARLTLARPLAGPAAASPYLIRPADPSDLPLLRDIARSAHHDSRFYNDPHFDRARCDALYETWIERSCQGFASRTLVAEIEGAPAGYISCHLSDAGQGSIGLFAVASHARGNGVGGALIRSSLAYFHQAGMRTAQVVTQERNKLAQHTYERNGFAVLSRQLWFHSWPQKDLS
jgi:dTDP-4-amino-4,6-dideoxy-D-galactose acyltransferase